MIVGLYNKTTGCLECAQKLRVSELHVWMTSVTNQQRDDVARVGVGSGKSEVDRL